MIKCSQINNKAHNSAWILKQREWLIKKKRGGCRDGINLFKLQPIWGSLYAPLRRRRRFALVVRQSRLELFYREFQSFHSFCCNRSNADFQRLKLAPAVCLKCTMLMSHANQMGFHFGQRKSCVSFEFIIDITEELPS